MAKRPLPTPEELRQLLRYAPETGKLYWRERPADAFHAEWRARAWNTRYAETVAGHVGRDDYIHLEVHNSRPLPAHRVAWAIVHGSWPSGQIDHINGDPSDNRLSNLREVSRTENQRNRGVQRNSTSGVMGVSWHPGHRRWHAAIRVNGKRIHLGSFDTMEQAQSAWREAKRTNGFHENHGERLAGRGRRSQCRLKKRTENPQG